MLPLMDPDVLQDMHMFYYLNTGCQWTVNFNSSQPEFRFYAYLYLQVNNRNRLKVICKFTILEVL